MCSVKLKQTIVNKIYLLTSDTTYNLVIIIFIQVVKHNSIYARVEYKVVATLL
jgi:hypothetical protein